MPAPGLDVFHDTSRGLDFVRPMESLLGEFRRGNIADPNRIREDKVLDVHLGDLCAAWEWVFGKFPEGNCRHRTLGWESLRGKRDAYLRRLIVAHVPDHDAGRRLIVNPATVLGRHARALARELPDYEVVGTDIDPRWERVWRPLMRWKYRGQKNYRFVRESIFEPDLQRRPAAVTFFGACGSVTDGCMDYCLAVNAPFLICRSCCHDNIGGNTQVVIRRTPISWFFAFKNYGFRRLKKKRPGFYFADRYGKAAYPRSNAAREIMDADTMISIARNTPDSDICRSLIDLDRCLYLKENGYDVMYREELFFAHRAES
ncbi:MAG: hypothetical protein ACYSU7_00510 [Planctomycetota bacterium]|jgi:hypothetical protein